MSDGRKTLQPAANNQQWRIVGALNAVTGRLDHLADYIVGRQQLIRFYRQLAATYPQAQRIYVVQDNWSIQRHPDVLTALAEWPQIEIVWLPKTLVYKRQHVSVSIFADK